MRYLIIGHGIREYAISKRLIQENHKVVAIGTKPNFGLSKICKNYHIIKNYTTSSINPFISDSKIDCVIITQEEALFSGVADICKVPVLGMSKKLAMLEQDKLVMKNLIAYINPRYNTPYKLFNNKTAILKLINQSDKEYYLKYRPPSSKYQIFFGKEIEKALKQASYQQFLLEEKIVGEEYSIYCFTDGKTLSFSKMIKDHPYGAPNNPTMKTGGMGSVMSEELVFGGINQEDYKESCSLIKLFLKQATTYFQERVSGIIGFQFIKSDLKNIHLIDMDVRVGETEIINLLNSIDGNFSKIINSIISGNLQEIAFNNIASIALCLVPSNYPQGNKENTGFIIDEDNLSKNITINYGNCTKKDNYYFTDSSRTIAINASGNDLTQCANNLQIITESIEGKIFYKRAVYGEFV